MIYIVKHKPYKLPTLPAEYKSICVGQYSEKETIDCKTGENIEYLNPKINELTAFYWLWKNVDDQIIGVNHYHRFFTDKQGNFLKIEQAKDILKNKDIICHSFNLQPYNLNVKKNIISSGLENGKNAFDIICKYLPLDYKEEFNIVINSNWYYIANLIITTNEVFKDYCKWIFSFIIDAANDFNPINSKPNTQAYRAMGYMGETMLSVWLMKNKINVFDCPYKVLSY